MNTYKREGEAVLQTSLLSSVGNALCGVPEVAAAMINRDRGTASAIGGQAPAVPYRYSAESETLELGAASHPGTAQPATADLRQEPAIGGFPLCSNFALPSTVSLRHRIAHGQIGACTTGHQLLWLGAVQCGMRF